MKAFSVTNSARTLEALSLACLSHLEQEEAMLSATLASLRQVRTSLVQGDLPALTAALSQQAHTGQAAAALQASRARLREELAKALGVPDSCATLGLLVERLPGNLGEQIGRSRQRLRAMAAEVERLNRANAALLRHQLEFLQQLLLEITGGQGSGPCYTALGQRQEAACGSLVEGQG